MSRRTERTTVRLPAELMRLAKRTAAGQGRTLTSLIEDSLRAAVSEKSGGGHKGGRVMPRVSKASSGLLPGVDLTTYSDTQHMDDLRYAARLKNGFK